MSSITRSDKPHRRDKGTGSIYLRKDGRWEARLRRDGQDTIYVYGESKKDVQNRLFAEQRSPRARDPEGLTVGEWLDRWLEIVKETNRLKTYDDYKSVVRVHLKPRIGSIKLSRLSTSHVYDMFDALRKVSVGDPTLEKIYKTLRRAVQVAQKRDKVARNVVALVDKPKAEKKEKIFLRTAQDAERFLSAAKGSPYEVLYLTALDTGCRSGELRALTWDHIDLHKGLIFITTALTKDEAGAMVATTPKTASSYRVIKLTKRNVEVLRRHQKQQMGSERGLSAWVFPNGVGGPLRKDGLMGKDFRRIVKRANVPGLTFHSLRHTHTTQLAEAGVPIRAIMERLGHSTSRVTLEVYSHTTAAMQDQAVAALDAAHDRAKRTLGRQIDRQPAETNTQQSHEEIRNTLSDAG